MNEPKDHCIAIRGVIGSGPISSIIQWRTDCKVDHVEFKYPFYNSPEWHQDPKRVMWIGSQPKGGVQIRPDDYIKNCSSIIKTVYVTEKQMYDMRECALDLIGEPYDYQAIFENAFNTGLRLFSARHRYDCSEFVNTVLEAGKVYLFNDDSWSLVKTFTPRDVIISSVWDY